MISINEIRNPEFTKTMMGGYKIEEVDELLRKVAAELEVQEQEKMELVKKLKILGDRVERYKSDEQYIQNALYDAQRIKKEADDAANAEAKRILDNAKKKSDEVRFALEKEVQTALAENERLKAEARREAEEIEHQANLYKAKALAEVERAKHNYIEIQSGIVEFRNTVIEAYKEHLGLVAALPSAESIKASAVMLDKKYPTNGSVELKDLVDTDEITHSTTNELVDEEIESIIHKTLEFDINDIKSPTTEFADSSTIKKFADDNSQPDIPAPTPSHVADMHSAEKKGDDKARVKVVKSEKKNRFSYTSRTVEAKRNTDGNDAPFVRLVDVNPEDLTSSLRRRQSEKSEN